MVVGVAEVGRDRDRVTGAGVGVGQGPAAHPGVEGQPGRVHGLHDRGGFHVAELAPVVEAVVLDAFGPAQENVGGGLHQPLPLDHPLAGGVELRFREMILQHRPGGLLDLQEQRVAGVAALQQHHPGPGADTAHPDHLAGHVHDREPLQQFAPVRAQSSSDKPGTGRRRSPGSDRSTGPHIRPYPATAPRPAAGAAIRYLPSTTSANRPNACKLSRVCAFLNAFDAVFSMSGD